MVYKRGGQYWYKFRWTLKVKEGPSENYVIRRSARTTNRKKATEAEEEHRRALRLGQVHPSEPWPKPTQAKPVVPTLREFSSDFLANSELNTKDGTVRFYRTKIDNLLGFSPLAARLLTEITGELIAKYAAWRKNQVTVTTLNGELSAIRAMLNCAEEWRRIPNAPKVHELPGAKGRDLVLSFEEDRKYLAVATRTLRDAALLMLDGGICPQSVLFVLRWENVHLESTDENPHGFVHVAAGKTKNRVRNIPLTRRCNRMLRERRNLTAESPWLFPSRQSGSGHLESLQHPHEDACQAAGIKGFTIYGFRHTFGTRCAQSGMDKFSVARLMGRSNPSVAERYYVYVTAPHVLSGFERFISYQSAGLVSAVKQQTNKLQ